MKTLAAALLLALALSARAEPLWVAVGEKAVRFYSKDGLNWKSVEPREPERALTAVVFGADKFVATVTSGPNSGSARPEDVICTSRDGMHWKWLAVPAFRPDQLVFGNGKFLAIRAMELRQSEDGEHFRGHFSENIGDTAERCYALAAGDTEAGFRYVAVGAWRYAEGPVPPWRAVTSDGQAWDLVQRDIEIGRLAYGAGHFLLVHWNGAVERSHDGQTWVAGKPIADEECAQLVWTGTRFLVRAKQTWASVDGVDWQRESSPLPGRVLWIRSGVGAHCQEPNGAILFARDEKTWQPTSLPKDPRIWAIAYRDQ